MFSSFQVLETFVLTVPSCTEEAGVNEEKDIPYPIEGTTPSQSSLAEHTRRLPEGITKKSLMLGVSFGDGYGAGDHKD